MPEDWNRIGWPSPMSRQQIEAAARSIWPLVEVAIASGVWAIKIDASTDDVRVTLDELTRLSVLLNTTLIDIKGKLEGAYYPGEGHTVITLGVRWP